MIKIQVWIKDPPIILFILHNPSILSAYFTPYSATFRHCDTSVKRKSYFGYTSKYVQLVVDKTKEVNQLTHKIIGCAMTVHSTIGNGFQEKIYQRALAIELADQNILFAEEQEMEIFYKGHHIGNRRVDFFIEGKIVLEIKATASISPEHKTQAINYLEIMNIPNGLLINFGEPRLKFNRVYNKYLINPQNPI